MFRPAVVASRRSRFYIERHMKQSSTATPPKSHQRWTVLTLVEWATNHLIERGFDEARLHVELLLAHVLSYSRLQLYTNFDRPLNEEELLQFKQLFRRRLSHEPLQYLLGETEFMGIRLFVDQNVLIPRPETEQLVEHVVEVVKTSGKKPFEILDIGTGSGNIPIAIAKLAPNSSITSIDISIEAQDVARKNIALNEISNVTLLHADMFDDFLPGKLFNGIVSNPPYVAVDEFSMLEPEVRDFEPRIATTDNGDGYRCIRRISELAKSMLVDGGFLMMEIGYSQAEEAKQIVDKSGLPDIEVFNDYAGHQRIISAWKR